MTLIGINLANKSPPMIRWTSSALYKSCRDVGFARLNLPMAGSWDSLGMILWKMKSLSFWDIVFRSAITARCDFTVSEKMLAVSLGKVVV